jgi:hypothetical protein
MKKSCSILASAPCPTGYIRHPSGSCVNLLIDFNNCGSINYVCSSTYTSCSNGACSGAPGVQLVGGVAVPGWGGAFNVDDAYLGLTAPFAISMYGYSTTTPSIQSNGVSMAFIKSCFSVASKNGWMPGEKSNHCFGRISSDI